MQVNIADTVGCGDSFLAAAALGWLREAEPHALLTLCNAVGAATAKGAGAGRQVRPYPQRLVAPFTLCTAVGAAAGRHFKLIAEACVFWSQRSAAGDACNEGMLEEVAG